MHNYYSKHFVGAGTLKAQTEFPPVPKNNAL